MLTSVFEMSYAEDDEVEEWLDQYVEHQPILIGDWFIAILNTNGSECKEEELHEDDYICYCLSTHPLSYCSGWEYCVV